MPPPVYRGHFGKPQAERLLWRAGFGPRPGEAERLARLGLDGAVRSLTRPKRERLAARGPTTTTAARSRLATRGGTTSSGGSTAWSGRPRRSSSGWRSSGTTGSRPRTTASTRQQLMLRPEQAVPRERARLVRRLLLAVTKDPAMLILLDGDREHARRAERELRARADGAVHARRRPRRLHRARRPRTGARAHRLARRLERRASARQLPLRHEAPRHGRKTIFGQRAVRLARTRAASASRTRCTLRSSSTKLWSYFVPTPPPAATQPALERLYIAQRHEVRPVVEAILRHPAFYRGRAMVKPPVVYIAGLLRALGRGIDTDAWAWLCSCAGQQLFYPPNVAGWDDTRWLDTARSAARWNIANYATAELARHRRAAAAAAATPTKLVRGAAPSWGDPSLDARHAPALKRVRQARRWPTRTPTGRRSRTRRCVENALRQLLAVVPRPADLLMADSCHPCDDFSRATLLRRAPPRPGAGCRRSSRGCPMPGGHRARPASVRRALGRARALRLRRWASSAALRGGHRPGGRRARRSPCSSRSSSTGGTDALSVLYPASDATYREAAPEARAATPAPGPRSPRTRGSTGTRR